MITIVRFRPGSPYKNADAPQVERALEEIAKPDGTFVPSEIVEAARPEGSPLHPYITWDDTQAARKYREREAGNLARSVEVRVLTQENDERWVPKYNSVVFQVAPGESERRYATLAVVKQSPDLVQQVQKRLEEDLLACRRRWDAHAHIPEFHQRFAAVFEEVDRLAVAD